MAAFSAHIDRGARNPVDFAFLQIFDQDVDRQGILRLRVTHDFVENDLETLRKIVVLTDIHGGNAEPDREAPTNKAEYMSVSPEYDQSTFLVRTVMHGGAARWSEQKENEPLRLCSTRSNGFG